MEKQEAQGPNATLPRNFLQILQTPFWSEIATFQMYHLTEFGVNLLNNVQKSPSKQNFKRKQQKMAIFRLSKICQKMKKNLTNPNFRVRVTTINMHHCAKFGVNPLNDVQNFHQKLKIANGLLTTERLTDRTYN